jgi:hypothetical protein
MGIFWFGKGLKMKYLQLYEGYYKYKKSIDDKYIDNTHLNKFVGYKFW